MTSLSPANQNDLARALFEESGDALFLLDPETDRLIEVNPVVLRLTGFSRAEILQFPATHFFRFESSGGHQRLRGAFSKTMVFHSQDGYLLRTKEEKWVPVNITVSRLHVQPRTLGLIIARDDRDRRQALTQARRVEAELRAVLGSSPAALWSAERAPGPDVHLGWQFRYVSPLLARIAGRSSDYFDNPFKWSEVVHPADREAYRTALRRLLTGTATDVEQQYRVQAMDGAVRWIRDRLQVVRDASGRPQRLDGCLVDFTEQRQAEEALRQSEQRFRALVEKSRDGIMLIDERGFIRYATPASRLAFGYEPGELVGKDFFDLISPADRSSTRKCLTIAGKYAGEDVAHTFHAAAADGTPRTIEMNACNRLDDPSVRALVVNYRDVTERNQLEEQLRQSHKLEAVGRLAGGIAHDFNNLLTVILGNLELVRSGIAGDEEPELLKSTERAARQAADLTKQMLGFARRQPLRTATLDLNAIVQEAVGLLRRTIDPRIAIRLQTAADLRPVAVDPVQIQQVLMNLCLNARDAMAEGGTLTVETANADVPRPPGVDSEAPEGGFVRVSVSDTGVGMTEEVRTKIFEPFFTTKDVGQGTGLGLAVVYGVARAHGGWVDCSSTPGVGSRFDVYLPRGKTSDELAAESGFQILAPARGSGEVILLADDEPMVRSLAQTALERQGYRVLLAGDGAEAVEVFQREGGRIALVVLDMSMPVMSGHQASAAIRKRAPRTKILFASGHPLSDIAPDDPISGFLHKPYTPSSLAIAVRKMLDATAAATSAR
jgi:PAS domain S-box-containing protein